MAVVLEVFGGGIAVRLPIVVLGGGAIATVPGHEAWRDVSGIVGGDERSS